jgi:hypothetical protein
MNLEESRAARARQRARNALAVADAALMPWPTVSPAAAAVLRGASPAATTPKVPRTIEDRLAAASPQQLRRIIHNLAQDVVAATTDLRRSVRRTRQLEAQAQR